MALMARPWGFELASIACPVELWHGTEDVNVPVGIARQVAAAVPGCVDHIEEGAGHAIALSRMPEIMATILRAGTAR
jgi:pimeloyl-ACP methyl ester carboxylesterase